jgi:hypothetical protein
MTYLEDPKDKKPSVSLTMMLLSFLILLGFCISSTLGYTKDPDALKELFYACAALYFGRRVSINNKSFSGKEKPSE